MKYLKKDYEIHIEVENKCLMNCKHCSSYEMRQLKDREFKYNDLANILKLIKGEVHLYMTGGEPLLYDELLKTLINIKEEKLDIKVGLFTCGIVNSSKGIKPIDLERAKQLKDNGVQDCYLSIYHKDELVHDFITSQPSSYKNTIETIKNLKEAQIEVKVHLIVNKFNVENLDNIIRYIERIGVKEIRILRLVKNGSAVNNWDEIGVSYDIQNKAIYEIISKIDTFTTRITVSGFPEYHPCRPSINSSKCQAGTNLLYITYQGEVYPCACTKNQKSFIIGKVNEIEKIQKYITKMEKVDYHLSCLNQIY